MSPTTSETSATHPFRSWIGHHAAIRVPDYAVSTAWFVGQLGWRIVQEWMYGDLQLAYIAPPGDDHFHVEILAGPGAAPQPTFDSVNESLKRNGLNHVCIQVASVDESLAELRRRNVTIVGEPFDRVLRRPVRQPVRAQAVARRRPVVTAATDANRDVVRAAFTAWQAGTAPITELFAVDMVWRIEGHSVASREYTGRQTFVDEVLDPFAARFAGGERFRPVTIRSIVADDDTVVVVWDGHGVANDGRDYDNSYAWIMRLADGLVVDGTAFYDSISFNALWERVRPPSGT